ncbi:MAG: hypothetical protein K0S44_1778 [Bacteroidetes bacterium]|jgi:hypothetical protein|nr:hypothetical protein [Bacteroidota bacterium]
MKTFTRILLGVFSMITFQAAAQEFIGTNVRFTKEIEAGGSKSTDEIGLIRLNNQSDEFSFDISMFSILTTPKDNDSIKHMNERVNLSFRCQFPHNDLEFLSNDGSETEFTIPGELTINNRTRPVNLILGMHSSMIKNDETRGIDSYPVVVSFIMEINPAEYGLDFETINFVRSIYVEVRNGVINKSNITPVVK